MIDAETEKMDEAQGIKREIFNNISYMKFKGKEMRAEVAN